MLFFIFCGSEFYDGEREIKTETSQGYSENANCLTKFVVKYIPYRGISLLNPYRNHQLHSQLIW